MEIKYKGRLLNIIDHFIEDEQLFITSAVDLETFELLNRDELEEINDDYDYMRFLLEEISDKYLKLERKRTNNYYYD